MNAQEYRPKYPVDLHSHTTRSDGNDSAQELIDQAAALGMAAVAITDHDIDPLTRIILSSGEEVDSVQYALSKGLNLVLGYEFSTNKWVDDVHICGYGLDWSHPDLQAEVAAAARSKSDAYRELCERLTQMGMPIDWDADILQYTAGDGTRQTRTAEEVQRKHIFETLAEKGHTESWSAAKLMVRDNPELNIKRRKIDSVDAINLIHRCGGIAVLAHPYLIDELVQMPGIPTLTRTEYIHQLVEAGLDGIEKRYTYDKTTYKGNLTPEEIEVQVVQEYKNRVRFLSGGSDYHAGHKKGEKKPRYLGERGLTTSEFQPLFEQLSRKSVL